MAAVMFSAGQRWLLDYGVGAFGLSTERPALAMLLFTNDREPQVTDTIADYTEADWPDYERASVATWSLADTEGEESSDYGTACVFTPGTDSYVALDVLGYLVVRTDTGDALFGERWSSGPIHVQSGNDPFIVTTGLILSASAETSGSLTVKDNSDDVTLNGVHTLELDRWSGLWLDWDPGSPGVAFVNVEPFTINSLQTFESYTYVRTLRVDETTGLTISGTSGGVGSYAGGSVSLALSLATLGGAGAVSTVTQTFNGRKTFAGGVTSQNDLILQGTFDPGISFVADVFTFSYLNGNYLSQGGFSWVYTGSGGNGQLTLDSVYGFGVSFRTASGGYYGIGVDYLGANIPAGTAYRVGGVDILSGIGGGVSSVYVNGCPGINVSPGGTGSDPTFTLSLTGELQAAQSVGTTGLLTRTASGVWTTSTISSGGSSIVITNGDGVGGNPVINVAQGIGTDATPTFAGMTVSGTANNLRLAYDGTHFGDLSANASGYLIVSASHGRIGLGTSSPSYPIDINQSNAANYVARVYNSSSTGYGLQVRTGDDTHAAILVNNAASTANRHNFFGSGHMSMCVGAGSAIFGVSSTSLPSGGGVPAIVLAMATGNPTGLGLNTAGFVCKDVATTAEMFTFDEAGTFTQLSSHAMDGPSWLYDDDDPLPRVLKEENVYLGIVRWTNESRDQSLRQKERLGKDLSKLSDEQKTCVHVEYYEPTEDWERNQDEQESRHAAECQEWAARKVQAAQELLAWKRLPSFARREIARPEPFLEEPPAPFKRKAMPRWLADRLAQRKEAEQKCSPMRREI